MNLSVHIIQDQKSVTIQVAVYGKVVRNFKISQPRDLTKFFEGFREITKVAGIPGPKVV